MTFSQHFACTYCGISLDDLEPRSFSFNSPYGACPSCNGLGTRYEVDPDLIVSNPELSLAQGAIGPWAGARTEYFSPGAAGGGGGLRVPDEPPVGEADQSTAQGPPARGRHEEGPHPVPQPVRDSAELRHDLRRCRAVVAAPSFRSGVGLDARAGRGLHAGGGLRRVRRGAPEAGVPGGDRRREQHRGAGRTCRSGRPTTCSEPCS